MSSWEGGKGSKPRPINDRKQFENNWDLIDWGKKKQQDAMFKQETETNEEVKDGDANQTL